MKLNKLYFIFISFIILFSACSNEIEENNTLKNETTTLKIQVQSSARTVLPQTVAPEELTDFLLTGKINNNSFYYCSGWDSDETFEHYNHNFRRKYSSLSDLQNEKIKLIPADWEFTLTAKKGGTTYKAEKTQTIVQGENTISFNLILDDTGQEKGAFSLSLDFSEADNANKVTSASASLQNIDGTAVTGFTTQTLSVSSCKVTYSEDQLPVGSYRALITLYSDNLELLTWREIIVISSDLVSSAERKLDSLNLYRITYKLNDDENSRASFTTTALETYNRHSEIRTLPQISRDYYDFEGWHLKEDLSDESITELPESVNGNVTVYAKWNPITYSIVYEFNGGDNNTITFINYTTETETFSLPRTKKNGYAFCGWYDNEEFLGNSISQIQKGSGGNKTLYAKWIPINIPIIYELNDSEAYPASFSGDSLDNYNFESTERTLPTLSRPYYDFIGWCLIEDLSDSPITELPNIEGTEVRLYAKWKLQDFSIIYHLNGGNFGNINPISTFTLESESFPLDTPSRPGYEFKGWYEENDFSGNRINQIKKGTTKNIIVYAKWNAVEVPINYYLNGGNFITEEVVSYKESLDCRYIIPYKAGKTFIGWSVSSNGTEIITTLNNGNANLYAQWANPAIGDIVLDDGRFIKQNSYTWTKMKAVAIIFKTNNDGCLGLGIYNSGNNYYSWCTKNAKLYNDYSSEISTMASISSGNLCNEIDNFSGDISGFDNWDYICLRDASKENYPAFLYAANYGGNFTSNLYKDGWYIPSGYELRQIYLQLNKLNSILEKIRGNKLINNYYWSSNTLQQLSCESSIIISDKNTIAFSMNMSTGGFSDERISKIDNRNSVCVIRKFSW